MCIVSYNFIAGEIMPNKCNPRIKPNNPDPVPNGIEHSFSSGDIKYVPLKEQFKGQLG